MGTPTWLAKKMELKSTILAEQPLASYIHSAAHALDLALQDLSKPIPLILNCFDKQYFHHKSNSSGPRPLCPTHVTMREASLSGVSNLYPAVQNFLHTSAYDRNDIGPKARAVVQKFESVKQYYRKIYEFLDNIINDIDDRFEQPGFENYLHLEKSLLFAPGSLDEHILTTISAFGIDMAKLNQEKEFTAHWFNPQKVYIKWFQRNASRNKQPISPITCSPKIATGGSRCMFYS
ncbi:hypothetical protein PR048_003647 [Dryococelus australis]|uniref:Uncharacterized protein n=1 Tax=Dryococelus australis TaxID=614101 RepID=A0ABQ9INN5_9NEOP|nr:hypothetical protein PR048_003647 [Dryococelus australis]